MRGHSTPLASAAFRPDGSRSVTASWDNTTRIWDAGAATEIAVLRGHDNCVLSAAFSPGLPGVPFGGSPLEFVRLAHDWRLVVVVLFVLGFRSRRPAQFN